MKLSSQDPTEIQPDLVFRPDKCKISQAPFHPLRTVLLNNSSCITVPTVTFPINKRINTITTSCQMHVPTVNEAPHSAAPLPIHLPTPSTFCSLPQYFHFLPQVTRRLVLNFASFPSSRSALLIDGCAALSTGYCRKYWNPQAFRSPCTRTDSFRVFNPSYQRLRFHNLSSNRSTRFDQKSADRFV